MSECFGRLHLNLLPPETLFDDSIGQKGEVIHTGNEFKDTQIDLDFITCCLHQCARYFRCSGEQSNVSISNKVIVECRPPKDELDKGNKWKITAEIKIRVGTQYVLEESCAFHNRNRVYRVDLDTLKEATGIVTVKFTQAFGLCVAALTDFKQQSQLRNYRLVVAGENFWINKGFLASVSPVFYTLFYGDFSEKEKEFLEISDVGSKHFEEFLQTLVGSVTITKHNVCPLLELSDRFAVESVRSKCSDVLIRISQKSAIKDHSGFIERLQLADTWRLAKLQAHLVEKMDRARLSMLNEDKLQLLEADTCQLLLEQAIKHLTK